MTINNLSIRERLLYLTIFAILAICGLSYFVILPAQKDILATSEQILNEKFEVEKRKYLANKAMSLKADLANVEPQLAKLNDVALNRSKELEFVTLMEGLASKNGVDQTLNLGTFTKLVGKYQKSPLTIEAKGNFTNIVRYINDIERLNIYVKLNEINMLGKNDEITSKNVSLKINAETYWQE